MTASRTIIKVTAGICLVCLLLHLKDEDLGRADMHLPVRRDIFIS